MAEGGLAAPEADGGSTPRASSSSGSDVSDAEAGAFAVGAPEIGAAVAPDVGGGAPVVPGGAVDGKVAVKIKAQVNEHCSIAFSSSEAGQI